MKRIAVISLMHETNSFSNERNDAPDGPVLTGGDVLARGQKNTWPQDIWIGGFVDATAELGGLELVPIAAVNLVGHRGGQLSASAYEHYQKIIIDELKNALPVDGVYFALHGALAVDAPYVDAEASLVRAARELLGPEMPFVGTYDFHGVYSDWEVEEGLVPFPMDTNPHIDGYERGVEAAQCIHAMLNDQLRPVTKRIRVPIIGPNVGQSTWSHIAEQEQRLPLYQLNLLRAELEQTPGVINLSIQGGYGYADSPDIGMCVFATTDNDPVLAEKMAKRLAQELWDRRGEIRTVRPFYSIDEGVQMAIEHGDGLVNLVDTGDDPGSACPADSPAVLEALIRLGAKDCALSIRDAEVVEAGLKAGVGAELTIKVGGKIDQRFYQPLEVTGTVRLIDDGHYVITGPTHAGAGRSITRKDFREASVGPRVVLRIGDKIDVIFSDKETGAHRDFFTSAGINFEEKRIGVVKSNQGHRASFDPLTARTIELRSPGVSTVDYESLPYTYLPRPLYPLDLDMEWSP